MSEEEKNKPSGGESSRESNNPRPARESYIGESVKNLEDIRKGAEIPPRPPRPTKNNDDSKD